MKRQILLGLTALMTAGLVFAESQPSKGAVGTINSDLINRCFKLKSKYVQQVCADYEIRYKLSSLMGEPVGNYSLSWKLASIDIKNAKVYTPQTIPEPLKKSVNDLELYIDGSAQVTSVGVPWSKTTAHYHRFNTGVAVKANKGSSYNTPGSPNWNQTFINSKPCSKSEVKYASVADAKHAFINGFTLNRLETCSGTEVYGVSYIDDAIEKLCRSEEGQQYQFCPKKEKKQQETVEDEKQNNPIDDAFAKLDDKSKKKADAENSVDGAFSALDQGKARNSKIDDIDSQFEQAEIIRQKNEKARIKAEQAREAARILAEKYKVDGAILTACSDVYNCR